MHGFTPRFGVRLMNVISIFKVSDGDLALRCSPVANLDVLPQIIILLIVVVSGWVVLAGGVKSIPDPHRNFRNGFAGSSHSAYNYASALFKVLNSFTG